MFCAARNRRRKARAFLFERTKERRKLVKVILTPLLVRVMMTLGAFHPRSEEKLAEHNGQLGRFAPIPINNGRPIAMCVPFSEQNFARELVIGLVAAERFMEPLIEEEDTLDANPVRVGTKEVRPFICPVLTERRMAQQV